jgi:small-conductance mechanosensitive channel
MRSLPRKNEPVPPPPPSAIIPPGEAPLPERLADLARRALDLPVLTLGDSRLTVGTVLYVVAVLFVVAFVTGRLSRWVTRRAVALGRLDAGVSQSVAAMVRYVLLVVAVLVVLQTAGIDITTFNILAGTVGLGIGIGLQGVANNFISGLIVHLERPIKIGDRIEVGDVEGDVVEIGARSTTVLTNDNISIIVPNSRFINENVVNWSHNDRKVRFRIPVPVAYGSDVRRVEQVLLGVASENPDVLRDPAPVVRFLEFGDSGLCFELRAWSTTLLHRKGRLTSDLNFGIDAAFRAAGIKIPFPQRDLHVRTLPEGWKPGA